MGSSAQASALGRYAGLPLVRRGHTRWLVRAPGRRGPLSPEEAAHALNSLRSELRRALVRRSDARELPAGVHDEIVDEAIGLVVMSRNAIRDEEHLQGAFWISVRWLLAERRSRRHDLRVGSRRRVEFEPLAGEFAGGGEPFDLVVARERIARAADLMAQLDPFEQRVLGVMAAYGLGVKRAARALGEPVKAVLAAARSAERKLDQLAVICAAGRMCEYRRRAIRAHARGTALEREERVARAHLAACARCRDEYVGLLREMSGREFQRAASAAFLPPPMIVAEVHGRWIERLTTFLSTGRAPTGTATAERTAGVLGGGGVVKAAAAGTALVIAGAGVGAKAIHSLTAPAPVHHHAAWHQPVSAATRATIQPSAVAGGLSFTPTEAARPSSAGRAVDRHAPPRQPPPSRSLGYLALGGSASDSASRPRASVAVASSTSSSSGSAGEAPPAPSRSGGGSSLDSLGR
ncbi:MAG: hypothetical protein ACHQC8_01940 [Solirubrobacterales bacterium]